MKYRKFLELLLVMSASVILSSCGKAVEMQEAAPQAAVEASVEASVEVEPQTVEVKPQVEEVEERKLYQGYVAKVIEDKAPLTVAYDSDEKVTEIPVDTLVNVTHELYKNDKVLDIIKVEYIDEAGNSYVGYLQDKYVTFDIQISDALSLDESQAVEEETTEEVTEETTEEAKEEPTYMPEVTLFDEPVTKYTNTSCNVRQFDSKDANLITTLSLNTAVTVTGTTESGWSQVNIDGVNAYIKSSLLSDTKTKTSSSQSAGITVTVGEATNDVTVQQPSQSEEQTAADLISQMDALFGGHGGSSGSNPTCGTTGSSGHTDRDVTFE